MCETRVIKERIMSLRGVGCDIGGIPGGKTCEWKVYKTMIVYEIIFLRIKLVKGENMSSGAAGAANEPPSQTDQ